MIRLRVDSFLVDVGSKMFTGLWSLPFQALRARRLAVALLLRDLAIVTGTRYPPSRCGVDLRTGHR